MDKEGEGGSIKKYVYPNIRIDIRTYVLEAYCIPDKYLKKRNKRLVNANERLVGRSFHACDNHNNQLLD